jgi:hypothetical protein
LALKVYTANSRNTFNFINSTSSNLISSNLAATGRIYQTPGKNLNLSMSQSNLAQTATSYYATSAIAANHEDLSNKALMDGTKSLPHKKKRKTFRIFKSQKSLSSFTFWVFNNFSLIFL